MGRREEKKLEKRRRLEREGLSLFLLQGYDRASIEAIATASDVARGTFYLYYPDKLSLFAALIQRWFGPLAELQMLVRARVESASTRVELLEIYQHLAMALAGIALTWREEILLAFREARTSGEAGKLLREREREIQQVVVALTKDAAARELITVEDPRIAALVIIGAIERLYYEVLLGEELAEPSEVARQVLALFGRALELPV